MGNNCLNSNCDVNNFLPLTEKTIALVDVVPWSIANIAFTTLIFFYSYKNGVIPVNFHNKILFQ